MRLALFQPDIPQNAGTLIRLAACFAVPIDIIEPAGFPLSDRALKRAALDYTDHAQIQLHPSWSAFLEKMRAIDARLVLMTTQAECRYDTVSYSQNDVLIAGRESAGVPDEVHNAADVRVRVPVASGLRSLNVAVASAIVLSEALRQRSGWPEDANT